MGPDHRGHPDSGNREWSGSSLQPSPAQTFCRGSVRNLDFVSSPRLSGRFLQVAEHQKLSLLAVGVFVLVVRPALLPEASAAVGVFTTNSATWARSRHVCARPICQPDPSDVDSIREFPHHSSTHVHIDIPPAHGAILAAAKVIAGPPWVGVWIAAAAMCAAITWMLQGWFPPAWALLGGPLRLYGLRRSVTGSIPNWSGAHAAVRRALLLGGLPRITERPKRVWPPFSSRPASDPVERSTVRGFDVSAAAAYRAGVELVRNRVQPELVMRNVALPIVIALVVFMIAMGYYNSRVFGGPLTLPYSVSRSMYAVSPVFVFQGLEPDPSYTIN